jgi:hypothetical protein
MPKFAAEDYHAEEELADDLAQRGFKHVPAAPERGHADHRVGRQARRGATRWLEARHRALWVLDMPTHTGVWEPTPFRQPMDAQVALPSRSSRGLSPSGPPCRYELPAAVLAALARPTNDGEDLKWP